MKRSTKQLLSALLTVAMIFGMLVVPAAAARSETPAGVDRPAGSATAAVTGESVPVSSSRSTRGAQAEPAAAGATAELLAAGTYTLQASAMTNASEVTNASGTAPQGVPAYFTLSSGVDLRNTKADKDGVVYLYFDKGGNNTVSFTVEGTATVTVEYASDGNGKTATAQLKKGGAVQKPDSVTGGKDSASAINADGTIAATDGTGYPTTATWNNLSAGDYAFGSTGGDGNNTTRLLKLTVVETAAGGSGTTDPGTSGGGTTDPGTTVTVTTTKPSDTDLGEGSWLYYKAKAADIQKDAATVTGLTGVAEMKQTDVKHVKVYAEILSGDSYKDTSAKLTAKGDTDVSFSTFVQASSSNGKAFTLIPDTDGWLELCFRHNAKKVITISKDGDAIYTAGDSSTPASNQDMSVFFPVKANSKYKLTLSGSKTSFFGFGFYAAANGTVSKVNAAWDSAVVANDAAVTGSIDGGKINVAVTGVTLGTKTEVSGTDAAPVTTHTTYATSIKAVLCNESGTPIQKDDKDVTATKDAPDKGVATSHTLSISPSATGKYTVKVYAVRSGETDKLIGTTAVQDFTLPLGKPEPKTAVKENCVIELTWAAIPEVTGYNVYVSTDKTAKGTAIPVGADVLKYTAEKLTDKTAYFFWVEAVRGQETACSNQAAAKASKEKPREWTSAVIGENVDTKKCKITTGLDDNANETVTITSDGNKFQTSKPAGEGITFRYTKIPVTPDTNFTLKAHVHVDSWSQDNSQVAFGLVATDYMTGSDSNYYTNMIMVGGADYGGGITGVKKAHIGVGGYYKHGATVKGSGASATLQFQGYNLDSWVGLHQDEVDWASYADGYSIVGNNKTAADKDKTYHGGGTYDATTKTWSGITDFDFILQRNNMGYYIDYVDANENSLGPTGKPIKIYDRDCLSQQDKDYIYVGMFTARKCVATFSNIDLTTKLASEDDFVEEIEYDYVTPSISLLSATNTNHGDYTLTATSNVRGTLSWTLNGVAQNDVDITDVITNYPNNGTLGVYRGDVAAKSSLREGTNVLTLSFQPWDEDRQDLEGGQKLSSTNAVTRTIPINWDVTYKDRNNLYVSPKASAFGNGTQKSPMTLNNAVKYVQPGQKIILTEGTYTLNSTVNLPLGTDGLPEKPIYLIADPEAETRPVLDFNHRGGGMQLLGNYWYLYGFDICNSTKVGLQIGGSYNTIDSVNLYRNPGSGMQISRVASADVAMEFWPHDNLVWRCASFLNADPGQTAADGFAHKETAGQNNVFRDCVAAYNSDDGWDFYAKGYSIGACTIDHCYTYRNAYIENANGDLVKGSGGGNGFKMGGDNQPAAPADPGHVAKNCFAFFSSSNGITSNSCPTIEIRNSVVYKNSANFNLYTSATSKHFVIDGVISVGSDGTPGCTPTNHKTVDDNAFVSTTFVDPVDNKTNTIKRDENGFIDFGDFLKLKDTADAAVKAVYPTEGTINFPAFADNQVPDFNEITPDVVEDSGATGSTSNRDPDRGGSTGTGTDTTTPGTETGTGTETTTPAAPAGADTVEAVKTETAVKADGTKVTTTEMSDGSEVVKEVTLDGDVAVEVTTEDGEKIIDIEVPADIPASETKFADVAEDHWAAAAIDRMASLGLVKGTGSDSYSPDGEVTRATLATMLFRFANGAEGKENKFADVQGHWAADAIAWAAEAGVVNGVSADAFAPDAEITREQMAVMLLRFAKLIGMDTSVDTSAAMGGYTDNTEVGSWASEGMAWCVKNGIINGTTTTTLAPSNGATRAQTAVMLDRFIGLLSK